MKTIAAILTVLGLGLFLAGCEDNEDPLALTVSVSGTITNNSGQSGIAIVEIDYNKKDIADSEGNYSIPLHKDYYIDSLYAYVDLNENNAYTSGEPFGSYPDPIHIRSSSVTNINFKIP